MAREISVSVGSGINQRLAALPRNATIGERQYTGTAVAILNPEDISAGGALLNSQITVSGVAVAVPSVRLSYRRSIAVHNFSGDTLYVGSTSGVTVNDGFPLLVGSTVSFEIKENIEVFAISDGSSDVRVMQASQVT